MTVLETKPAAPSIPRDRVGEILRAVSARKRVPVSAILGPERYAATVRARHLAIYLTRRTTRLSLAAIGCRFGGRCNATVVHACQKIGRLIERGELPKKDVAVLAELGVSSLPPATPAVPLVRVFLAADGPDMDAEIARQAGPGGIRPDDEIIVMVSPESWTLPNGEVRWASEESATKEAGKW